MSTSDVDYENLFLKGRLLPWIPDHAPRIQAYLGLYHGTKLAKDMKEHYEKLAKEHGPAEEYGDGSGGHPEKGPHGEGFPGEEIEGRVVSETEPTVAAEEVKESSVAVEDNFSKPIPDENPKKKRGRPKKTSSPS